MTPPLRPTDEGRPDRRGTPLELGQATTEYALVILAAAFVGLMVVGWATTGSGAETVSRLFDRILRTVLEQV